jgi:hypothetical protein
MRNRTDDVSNDAFLYLYFILKIKDSVHFVNHIFVLSDLVDSPYNSARFVISIFVLSDSTDDCIRGRTCTNTRHRSLPLRLRHHPL